MSSVSSLARIALSLGLPAGILDRGPSLRGTKFLAKAALKARLSGAKRRFQMVNVGACDGVLFDDVTPWLHRMPHARAPYWSSRSRTTRSGCAPTIPIRAAAALEAGTLPIEFIGCSSVTDTNLMSGKNAWGQADANFNKFAPHLRDIEVPSETLQTLLDRNGITHIDAFLVDCEGADWIVFEQLDLERYRPGMIKVEVGALPAAEIGQVVVKLKTAGYQVGFQAEDIWAFA
nr:FkbM family methyltransferase [Mesorhizobium sp.]